MIARNTLISALGAVLLSGAAYSETFADYTLDQATGAKGRALGGATELIIGLDYAGEPVSAFSFMLNLEGTGLRAVNTKSCMAGLPDSHKGDGALSACNSLDKGNRVMIAISDLGGMTAVPNGYIGSIKLAPAAGAKSINLSAGRLERVELWGQDQSALTIDAKQSPILLSFE